MENGKEKQEVLFLPHKLSSGQTVYDYFCPWCGKEIEKVVRERPCNLCGKILLPKVEQ